jgi:hypothetical protein
MKAAEVNIVEKLAHCIANCLTGRSFWLVVGNSGVKVITNVLRLSDRERDNPPPVGSIITFRYQELSDTGIPRFPIYIGIRIDADWEELKNKR